MMAQNDLESSALDALVVVVSRVDVEEANTTNTLAALRRMLISPIEALRFQGRVDLAFHGYDADPRDLYEIAEVRQFCKRLDEEFPFWFFFLSPERDTLKMLTLCLCRNTKMATGLAMPNPNDLDEFIGKHFSAMNLIFDNMALEESLNERISKQILVYYGGG